MQKTFEQLDELVRGIPQNKIEEVAKSIKLNLDFLIMCYNETKNYTHRNTLLEKINYDRLVSVITGEKHRGKKVALADVTYSIDTIEYHKKNGVPKEKNKQAIMLYNFYFDGYKQLFNIFDDKLLEKVLGKDSDFLRKILTARESESTSIKDQGNIGVKDNILIPGTITIDETFIDQIRNYSDYSPEEFYTAKQDDKCQWYGIIKDYDILRIDYEKLLIRVNNAFESHHTHNISAIVFGKGGAGKSTILKRLAIDCCDASFTVLWLDSFNKFVEHGLDELSRRYETNFLLIIEDWYRMIEDHKSELVITIKKFLQQTKEFYNLRLVIGDRVILGKEYMKDFLMTEAIELKAEENEKIISAIVSKHKGWREIARQLFENDKNHEMSLFLLLFVIYRIDHSKIQGQKLESPKIEFIRIIESDLWHIANEYRGLAKALFYWASQYANSKIFISYSTFLNIADYYNRNSKNDPRSVEIYGDFSNLELQTATHELLRIYIHESPKTGLLHFNHDILAEQGISQINMDRLELKWNDKIKREILYFIVKNGDDRSASIILSETIKKDPKLISYNEKITLTNLLLKNNNRHYSYMNCLLDIDLQATDLKRYRELITNGTIKFPNFWRIYLKKTNDSEIEQLLLNRLNEIWNDYPEFTRRMIIQFPDRKEVRNLSNEILKNKQWRSLNNALVADCITVSDDKLILEKFCSDVLTDQNLYLDHSFGFIIERVINTTKDNALKINYSDQLLKKIVATKKWMEVNPIIITKCLKVPETRYRREVSKIILEDFLTNELWKSNTHLDLINSCLKISHREIAEEFSNVLINNFLTDELWKKKNYCDMIINSLKFNEKISRLELSIRFLNLHFNTIQTNCFPDHLINFCFKSLTSKDFNISYLINWEKQSINFIYQALCLFENDMTLPLQVNQIIEKVIANHENKKLSQPKSYINYINILRIGFHINPTWKKKSLSIIKNWRSDENRTIITNVLWAYKASPCEIEEACRDILNSWILEVNSPIAIMKSKHKTKGYHIKLALGHPNLKIEAKRVATEMINAKVEIPDYLRSIALYIIELDFYPVWMKE